MDYSPRRSQEQPIAYFFKKDRLIKKWMVYCNKCGLPFMESNQTLSMVVDNPGSDENEPYTQIMCKRCKQLYRVHVL